MPKAELGRGRGRPVEKPMPERIPDTPENIAAAFFRAGKKEGGGRRQEGRKA